MFVAVGDDAATATDDDDNASSVDDAVTPDVSAACNGGFGDRWWEDSTGVNVGE